VESIAVPGYLARTAHVVEGTETGDEARKALE
jgi:hypothetical protein